MSGSLLFRSGVGTQMMMASAVAACSNDVERGEPARPATSGARASRGDVDQVGLTAVQQADPLQVQIDAAHREAGLGELDREAQTDVTETDDADARGARLELFEQAIGRHGPGHSLFVGGLEVMSAP